MRIASVTTPFVDAPTPWVGSSTQRTLQWTVLRLDLSRVELVARPATSDRVSDAQAWSWALAAVDSGFFEPDHRPSGSLVSEGRAIAPRNERGGSGVLVLQDGVARLLSSATDPPLATLAVQCGPRLIENNGAAGIQRDNGQRAARTAVCLRDAGRTLDVVLVWSPEEPMQGPGLLGLSRMLSGASPWGDARGCEAALNLDGGPSTGLWVRDGATHEALGPTPWLLVVRAR